MEQQRISKGMLALAAFVLVGGTACQEGEGEFVSTDQEALEEDGDRGRHGRGMKRGMGPGPRIMANLDLSEEQEAAIAELRAKAREEHREVREQMGELRSELRELWEVDQPDADAILAKHSEMDALHDSMRGQRHGLKQAIEGVLTDEQRAELAEHRENRPTKGKRGRGHGFRGRGDHDSEGMGPRRGRFGRGKRGGHGMHGLGLGRGGRGERALEQLDLSEEQEAQIEALREQAEEATSDARAELTEVREAMRNAHRSGDIDESAVEALEARADTARQTVRENSVRTRIAILGVLTAEQRTELQELRAQRGERRGMGHGHGRGQGRGFGRGHGGGMGGDGIGRGPGFGRGHGKALGRGHRGGRFGGGRGGELAD